MATPSITNGVLMVVVLIHGFGLRGMSLRV